MDSSTFVLPILMTERKYDVYSSLTGACITSDFRVYSFLVHVVSNPGVYAIEIDKPTELGRKETRSRVWGKSGFFSLAQRML